MSSKNIPFEIQVEIMKRSPVKSLIRFRSVSKQWKYLIDSSEFISDHIVNLHHHHLLVCYKVEDSDCKFILVADDDSFPHRTVSITIDLVTTFMIDCSHGLVCLHGWNTDMTESLVIVWNPSIRKSVVIVVPHSFSALGFGVCPKTMHPKIVKITGSTSMDLEAEVFSLSFGVSVWRSVSMNLPYNSIQLISNQVVLDGVIYWVLFVKITTNNEKSSASIRILSFDLTSEEFRQGDVPDSLAREIQLPYNIACPNMFLSKLNKSLVVLNYCTDYAGKRVCHVWMMLKTDVLNPSFTKLFTVDGLASYAITGFRKTGQPIMEKRYKRNGSLVTELEVYEHSSQHINGLGIYGSHFQTASYTESLLLLNHTRSKYSYPF